MNIKKIPDKERLIKLYRLNIQEIRALTPGEIQARFKYRSKEEIGEQSNLRAQITLYSFQFAEEKTIGFTRIDFDLENSVAEWKLFYPLACTEGLKRIGLGTLAQVGALTDLAKLIPQGKSMKIRNPYPSPDYESLLDAMQVQKEEDLVSYFKKSVNYATAKGFRF